MKSASRILILLAVTLVAVSANADKTENVTMVLINAQRAGWPEQDLRSKMERLLSSRNNFELVAPIESELLAQELEGRFDKQELIDWGLRIDCRYIIWFDVVKEDLSVEKHFSIPFFASQKRVTARLDLDYYIVDCLRGCLVQSDRISGRKYGPSSLQLIDDLPADPDLHIGYPDEKELFDKLETDAVGKVFAELERIAKQK
jgi:hypothetical protein